MPHNDLIRVSQPRANYTSTGKFSSYTVECFHDGLKDHRVFKSSDPDVLTNKIQTLIHQWEAKWAQAQLRQSKVASASAAEEATARAQDALAQCEKILAATLDVDDRVNWALLKRRDPFVWDKSGVAGIKYLRQTREPIGTEPVQAPQQPDRGSAKYAAQIGLLDHMLPFLKRAKIDAANALYANDLAVYEKQKAEADATTASRYALFREEAAAFATAKAAYDEHGRLANAKIDQLEAAWKLHDPEAVAEHADLVLNQSAYPDWLNVDYSVTYLKSNGMLVVDYQLPSPQQVPTLERVSYVKSRDEISEKRLTDAKAQKLFDSICYQIALRTIHELFEADDPNAIKAVTFNGWVESINKATGRTETACILSVQALKEEFLAIDLARVDPKACFKLLKGVAASSLSQLAPVRPMIKLDRNDARFVDSYGVADSLDESTNLAAMNWEDFEHLVRELFSKIFSAPGAEVRVTQASRDGGVDAIALDPDPIKGGKIVIQAKRYTGTVGVSAVRDLYGTVMNEGANRGILVTTSDYGPDAYKFATGKPLTLLSGSNLLSLLADHGHAARIDLAEARRSAPPA